MLMAAKLSPMRFKGYVWPHNPRVYGIEYRREVRERAVPFGLYVLQNMGRRHRVLRGEGEFCGAGAYAEFKKLATVFYENTPGLLVHPLWDTATAYFVALELEQEPTENYVRYSFEFWECFEGYRTALKAVGAAAQSGAAEYVVAAGDSIWSIAAAQGMDAAALLALNPDLRNANLLAAGTRLRLR